MRLLFVCSYNRMRSPTAEVVFSTYPGVETLSAGTSSDAEAVVSAEMIDWADVILVMEPAHRKRLNEMFKSRLRDKRIVVLDIPDQYAYMDPELVRILEAKVPRYVRLPGAGT